MIPIALKIAWLWVTFCNGQMLSLSTHKHLWPFIKFDCVTYAFIAKKEKKNTACCVYNFNLHTILLSTVIIDILLTFCWRIHIFKYTHNVSGCFAIRKQTCFHSIPLYIFVNISFVTSVMTRADETPLNSASNLYLKGHLFFYFYIPKWIYKLFPIFTDNKPNAYNHLEAIERNMLSRPQNR